MPTHALKKSVMVFGLSLSALFANASYIDITENSDIKPFGLSDYSFSSEKNSLSINLWLKDQIKLYNFLDNPKTTHIAFYSEKLKNEFNKKQCILIHVSPNDINYKVGFSTTVTVSNLNIEDLKKAEAENCLAVSADPLRTATGINPTYGSARY